MNSRKKQLHEKVKKTLHDFIAENGEERFYWLIDEYSRFITVYNKDKIKIMYPSKHFKKPSYAEWGILASVEGKIVEEIVKNCGKEIKQWSYTPEDMSTPLEEVYYVETITNESDLKNTLNELKGIEDEIEKKFKSIIYHMLSELSKG